MSFLAPLFFFAAAAVALPITLHLLRRRIDQVVDLPTARWVGATSVEQQHRRRLRERVLLALRVLALSLLAFAFARPFLTEASVAAPRHISVLLIDTSLSLSAPGQFDRVREAARDAVGAAADSVAVISLTDGAHVLVPPTTDRGGALAAIGALQPSAGRGNFAAGLARAGEVLGDDEGQVVVISDLQEENWDQGEDSGIEDDVTVTVREIASPPANAAVVDLRRDQSAAIATVQNASDRAVDTTLRLVVDGVEIAIQALSLPASASREVRLVLPPTARGVEVRVDDPSGYAWDNSRYLSIDGTRAGQVVVITGEAPSSGAGLYVERALAAVDETAGRSRALQIQVVDGRSLASRATQPGQGPAGLVLLGTSSLDRQARTWVANFIREGGRALLTLGPTVDLATLSDLTGTTLVVEDAPLPENVMRVTLVAADARHPIFRPFSNPSAALGDIHVERYRRLQPHASDEVLATFSGAGAALIERPVGQGRLLVFTSDLDNRWNRFPLNPAFVPWIVETVRYLAQHREQPASVTLPDVPPGVRAQPGLHRSNGRLIAVNPDPRESTLARLSAETFLTRVPRRAAVTPATVNLAIKEQEERQRLWQTALLAVVVLLMVEGVVARKASSPW